MSGLCDPAVRCRPAALAIELGRRLRQDETARGGGGSRLYAVCAHGQCRLYAVLAVGATRTVLEPVLLVLLDELELASGGAQLSANRAVGGAGGTSRCQAEPVRSDRLA